MPINVRQEMDKWTPEGPEVCFALMERELSPVKDGSEITATAGETRKRALSVQLASIRSYFEKLGWETAAPQVRAMLRYYFEGCNTNGAGYTEDLSVYRNLGAPEWTQRGGQFVDLGCGPGRFVAEQGEGSRGVDLSPSFCFKNERVDCGVIDAPFPDLIAQINGGRTLVGTGSPSWAFSSLTLDRVRDPAQLIENLGQLGKTRVTLATLLPVVPVDDGPNVQRRVEYTPPELRLTPGSTEEEDRCILQEYLADRFRTAVQTTRIPYLCRSSDGEQRYDQYWAFDLYQS